MPACGTEASAPSSSASLSDLENHGRDADRLRLLLIEDSRVDVCRVRGFLESADGAAVELEQADRLSAGLSRLKDGHFDALLIDLNLPDSEGVPTVAQVHACSPRTPIVVLTGVEEMQVALQAAKAGAEDYLFKGDLGPDLLLHTIRYAIVRSLPQRSSRRFTKASGSSAPLTNRWMTSP
jgi:DNA-binding NarL/FixJ family response regulator